MEDKKQEAKKVFEVPTITVLELHKFNIVAASSVMKIHNLGDSGDTLQV